MNKNRVRRQWLDIEKVMEEFSELEASQAHRKGTFKINEPFEKALNSIVKAKIAKKKR